MVPHTPRYNCLTYQRVGVDAAVGLTIPAGTVLVTIQAEGQIVRMRLDSGGVATTTSGQRLLLTEPPAVIPGGFSQISLVGEAAGGFVNVHCFGN